MSQTHEFGDPFSAAPDLRLLDRPVAVSNPEVEPARVSRQAAVEINTAAMQGGDAEQVVLNLFDEISLTVHHARTEYSHSQGYAWYGTVEGNPQTWVVLVVDQNRLSGAIQLPEATAPVTTYGPIFSVAVKRAVRSGATCSAFRTM